MTQQELNKYILHYLTKDKTKSAIMLTGSWGTGKSHYILNSLVPFLSEEENGDHKCVVVSLYGLKDTFEISRSIYLECRAKFLNGSSEKTATGMFIGKTIVKGIVSHFGVDLSKSSDEMRELYESVDLSGKLVVLEDLERSGIDIVEVLGYVNSLVEQDGVKVLLVANEDEIIKKEAKAKINEKKKEEIYYVNTKKTEQYLRTKEKTVSDTILFEEDYISAIQQIILSFKNDVLSRFASPESAKDISDIMYICKSRNIRSFIFACQKTADIYASLDPQFTSDDDFVQAIFFGILFYVLRIKNGKELRWGKETLYSAELGHEKFPLFKFCYDYLTRQIIETSNIQDAYDSFKELTLFDKSKSNSDPDIIAICSYHIHSEDELLTALSNIETRLENDPDAISFYMYGTIAVYSIIIKSILGCDITKIKSLLVSNLNGKGAKLSVESIFRTVMGDNVDEAVKKEYQTLRKEMAESLQTNQQIFSGFDYQPEQAAVFYNRVAENEMRFHSQEGFASILDIDRMAEMFRMCSQEQKDNIRGAFLEIYRPSNIKSFLSSDYENIMKLLDIIKAQRECDVGDKIQQLQYDYFIGNLTEIAEKLR